jgi:predicted phosphohydrolase
MSSIVVDFRATPILLLAASTFGCQPPPEQQGNHRAAAGGDLSHAAVPRGAFDAEQRATCGPGGASEAGRRAFDRTPYLQRTTTNAISLLWTTPRYASFEVEVVDARGALVTMGVAEIDDTAELPLGRQWIVELGGLDADTMYCYRVLADGVPWTQPTGFRTAPPPGLDTPIRFAALGDLGTQTLDQFAVLEQLEQVDLDFVVFTGDLAYDNGRLDELEASVFGVYDDLMATTPVFPASGNHDYYADDAQAFRDAFALFENGGSAGLERWYSFDWGDVHFAVLDTERIVAEQVQWLDDDLAATDRRFKIVVAHRPPFSSGEHGSDGTVRSHFVPLFEKHHVSLVLLGHEHDYERTESIDGVTYVITGGGGHGTRAVGRSDFTAFADDVAHFVFVEATPQHLRAVAVDATGEPFDSVRIAAPAR